MQWLWRCCKQVHSTSWADKRGLMPPQYGAPATKFGQICREPCTACLVRNSRGISARRQTILNTKIVYINLDFDWQSYSIFSYVMLKVWDRGVRAGEEYAVWLVARTTTGGCARAGRRYNPVLNFIIKAHATWSLKIISWRENMQFKICVISPWVFSRLFLK